MVGILRGRQYLILILSLLGIYILAPDLDRQNGPLVSTCFALILILNSGIVWQPKYFIRYLCFIPIDIFTYYILFNDQPWDYLLHGGLFESSPIPIIFCSIIMSLAGGLLLKTKQDRIKYFIITLGLQIPIAIFAGTAFVEGLLLNLSDILEYTHSYHGAWQAWQFEWMMTYYLPMYFLGLRRQTSQNNT
jgi:hypothetical protein